MKRSNLRSIGSSRDYDRRLHKDRTIAQAYQTTAQVWMLRMLWRLGGRRQIGELFNLDAEDVVGAVGLELEPDQEPDEALSSYRLSQQLEKLESSYAPEPCTLTNNLDLLTGALSLEPVDRDILELLLMFRKHAQLVKIADTLGSGFTLGDAIEAIAVILDHSPEAVRDSLSRRGKLRLSGLIQVERRSTELPNKILVLSHLLDAVSMPHDTAKDILATFVDVAPDPELTVRDFDDYQADLDLLRKHLIAAIAHQRIGCNILIYGEPGVGKTQLVRVLAKHTGVKLFEIMPSDNDGEPLSATQRLGMFQLTQRFLGKSRDNVILFDEVEDIFPNTGLSWLFGRGDANARKAWINEQLEHNPIPVFWLANDVSQIDSAHLRRFDLIIELRPMSAKARARVLRAACRRHGLKGGKWIAKAAQHHHLSPALIERVSSVVASTQVGGVPAGVEVFERVANGVLAAMQRPALKLREARPILPYSLDVVRTDVDLAGLVAGLKRSQSGRLLCYGPPGTGKTAFARYLAKELKLPILQFRASDILGPYVGMTERNIATAFRQAREEGAIMLLDEIDSLLQSREGAARSWEVTQVNELLVQMEEHPGILIACTNFREGLDSAAARRFDVKIGFDYLSLEAAWTFFQKVLRFHNIRLGRQQKTMKTSMSKLRHLTLGDFKVAVRKSRLSTEGLTAVGLIESLEAEIAMKPEAESRGIGFAVQM